MTRPDRGTRALGAGLLLTILAATPAPAQESSWISLFDGQTLSGWTVVPLREGAKTNWEVQNGQMVGSGEPSMLYSPRGDYKNFRYRAEIKVNDRGNSGMYVRVPEKKPTFTDGYEIQVNSTHTDPIKTGSIYTMVHVYDQIVPPDEFFTQEVEVVDKPYRGKVVPHITVTVNGKKLYQFLDHSRTWKMGHFAFQQHDPGSKVTIRKVEVMELPPPRD